MTVKQDLSFVEAYYAKHDPEELMEEVARLLAMCADSFFFEPDGCYQKWDQFETDDITRVKCSEDLENLKEMLKEILETFDLGFEEIEEVDPCGETIIDAVVVPKEETTIDVIRGALHNLADSPAGTLEKKAQGHPLSRGCDICLTGHRQFQLAVTHQWVCLDCYRSYMRESIKAETEGVGGTAPLKKSEPERGETVLQEVHIDTGSWEGSLSLDFGETDG